MGRAISKPNPASSGFRYAPLLRFALGHKVASFLDIVKHNFENSPL